MTENIVKYTKQIEAILKRYGSEVRKDSIDDLMQDIQVSILSCKDKLNKKAVTEITRKCIINFLQKAVPRCEDISDPDTREESEERDVHFPDIDRILDAEKAVGFVYKLPEPYRDVILNSFGIEDELNDKQIADKYKKSQRWVSLVRVEAIKKLRNMMGE